MKRYVIARLVERTNAFGTTVMESKTVDYKATVNQSIVKNLGEGWALVRVAGPDLSALLADPDIEGLPDFPLDGKVDAIARATRTKMERDLSDYGIEIGRLGTPDGYRHLIRALGLLADPNFNEDGFDVSEG